MDLSCTILDALKACPTPEPDGRWRYTYELIVGAAASLLSASPHYIGTRHYNLKKQYESRPETLHDLLHEAQAEADRIRKPINLYYEGLEDWTAGYFFNSGIVRIACAYEYAICTAGNTDPFDMAKFEEVSNSLKKYGPPVAIKQLLEIFESFKGYGRTEGRKKLNSDVDALASKFHFEEQATAQSIYEELANHEDFLRAAVLFVWSDYNWFKHRPMGYPGSGHPRERPAVQFALALRGYRALCDLYSWCRNLEQNSAQANPVN